MDAKTRRVLKAKQGKVSTSNKTLSSSEGYEGQVQIRDTKDGPMLFAKLKGKWIQSPLLPGGDFFVPKAFTAIITLPSASGKPCFVVPKSIPLRNILNISIVIEEKTASETFFVQTPQLYHVGGNAYDWIVALKSSTRQIYLSRMGDPTFTNKKAKLTILYK
tara:strand:- start:7197 stop:7682 length:486 start_codon:yes stop_codon:yes gene_type:complete